MLSRPRRQATGAHSDLAREHAADSVVILDADDTLWLVEPLYDEARAHCRRIVESAGLDGGGWECRARKIDVKNVARFGLSRCRFPTSCVEAYRELAAHRNAELEARIWSAASAVFDQPAPLVPNVHRALELMQSVSRLVLLSKGDATVQRQRLARSGLDSNFDDVRIVDEKDENAFREIAMCFSVPLDRVWSVGNSLKSDIIPALSLGMQAVWVDADVWEHERSADDVRRAFAYLRADTLLAAAMRIVHVSVVGTSQRSADFGEICP